MKENVVMSRVNVAEAKAHFSRYLRRVKAGETILICERNVPVAEIRPLQSAARRRERSLEPIYPDWEVPDSFFEPLPDDLLDAFEKPL